MLAGMQPMDEMLRQSGHFGPRVEVPTDADDQTRLIAFTGRHALTIRSSARHERRRIYWMRLSSVGGLLIRSPGCQGPSRRKKSILLLAYLGLSLPSEGLICYYALAMAADALNIESLVSLIADIDVVRLLMMSWLAWLSTPKCC